MTYLTMKHATKEMGFCYKKCLTWIALLKNDLKQIQLKVGLGEKYKVAGSHITGNHSRRIKL